MQRFKFNFNALLNITSGIFRESSTVLYVPLLKKILLVSALSTFCWAQIAFPGGSLRSAQKIGLSAFFNQFDSPTLQIINPKDSELWDFPSASKVSVPRTLQAVAGWTPINVSKAQSPDCSLEKNLLNTAATESKSLFKEINFKVFYDRCENELQVHSDLFLSNIYRIFGLRHQILTNPYYQKIMVNFPDGSKVRGLLALKGDLKPRPLIIFRAGLFSRLEEMFGERFFIIQIFEQSPFNLLILENSTSPVTIALNNSHFSLGGYFEGLQNSYLADKIRSKNEPLEALTSSIHLSGVSLGGHGVLASSILTSTQLKNNSRTSPPSIQSFLALCPVINLQDTLQELRTTDLQRTLVNLWAYMRLGFIEKYMQPPKNITATRFLDGSLELVTRRFKFQIAERYGLKYPDLLSKPNFWEANDISQSLKENFMPILFVTTQKDHLVPYEVNTERFKQDLASTYSTPPSNFNFIHFPKGVHCSLGSVYDWKFLAAFFRNFISQYTPEQLYKKHIEVWPPFNGKNSSHYEEGQLPFIKEILQVSDFEIIWPATNPKEPTSPTVILKFSDWEVPFDLNNIDFELNTALMNEEVKMMLERWIRQNVQVSLIERSSSNPRDSLIRQIQLVWYSL